MLVRATRSFMDEYSPLPVVDGELLEVEDELGKTWVTIGYAIEVELTDAGIVPITGGDPIPDTGKLEIVESPYFQRRKKSR